MTFHRRSFLKAFGAGLLAAPATSSWAFARPENDGAAQQSSGPTSTPEEWMSCWMQNPQSGKKKTRGESGELVLGRFADPMWFLRAPIAWVPKMSQQSYKTFTAPAGFVTDLASIPAIFWSVLPPDGDYAYAAILHDYLYWTQIRPKDQADMVLKLAMQDFGVSALKVEAIYQAVHRFGKSAWERNAAWKRSGQSRFLVKFPVDPTVRWSQWQASPGNFGPNQA